MQSVLPKTGDVLKAAHEQTSEHKLHAPKMLEFKLFKWNQLISSMSHQLGHTDAA